ncbi:MAG TPA: HAD family hydrolase [Polyangiaceae bacterium]|nr:HAD family hydrolase [Polyangiaceae bacterium]
MSVTALPTALAPKPRTQVRAWELASLLDEFPGPLKVLSLDCFDTLLWRRTATPVDVFFDLASAEPFSRLGMNAKLRMVAERTARDLARVRHGRSEVGLFDIYRAAFPELDAETLADLARAELDAEKRACYALPHTVALIRAAKKRGLKVIVVSDTYLDERQLRSLLAATMPKGTADAIDRVFCSSHYGRSKVDGLFIDVLKRLNVAPWAMLHVGDNRDADYLGAKGQGISSLHLVHHEPAVEELLRLETTAGNVLCPDRRSGAGAASPYRALLATKVREHDPERLLGYAAAGPILYAFARFVVDELEELRAKGKNPKALFLMRDAHLPRRVCSALSGHDVGAEVAISRFAAYAASFRAPVDVERYVAAFAGGCRFEAMAKQLLLPNAMASDIIADAEAAKNPPARFAERVLSPEVSAVIVERSAAYRARLFRYLTKAAGIEKGDTIVFVDLGYEGTAQRLLEPVFRDALEVEVVGRYLMVSRTPGWERSRRGLIDPHWCDDRTIATLVPHVAVLEDICTSEDGTVLDYDDAGDAVRAEKLISPEQLGKVKQLQEHTLAFARDAEHFFGEVGGRPDAENLRAAALAALGRLIFFPTAKEVEYLEGFCLDMNLGTTDALRLFDRESGLTGLRRRGMFFMEKHHQTFRTNYPVELRAAGIELSLALLAQRRFTLELVQSDCTLRVEPLRVLVARGNDGTAVPLEAQATHDGYFALLVPVGAGDLSIGVIFGEKYAWVQLESVELVRTSALFKDHESQHTESVFGRVQFEGMAERAPGLYECLSDAAFAFLGPKKPGPDNDSLVCRVVFRPISPRL